MEEGQSASRWLCLPVFHKTFGSLSRCRFTPLLSFAFSLSLSQGLIEASDSRIKDMVSFFFLL